jgi:hypothetical protein
MSIEGNEMALADVTTAGSKRKADDISTAAAGEPELPTAVDSIVARAPVNTDGSRDEIAGEITEHGAQAEVEGHAQTIYSEAGAPDEQPPTAVPASETFKRTGYDALRWVIVNNDGDPDSMVKLVGLKSLFSKQLPSKLRVRGGVGLAR